MGYSYTPLINKKNRDNKTGKHSIFIRVTVDRESKYLNTGEKIEEKYWAGKEGRWTKDSHPFAFQLNTLIRKKVYLLEEFEYKQKMFGNGVSLKSLCDHFYKKAYANVFNEYVDEFMKTVKGKSLNTLKKYRTFVSYLNEYNSKINFSQLNEQFFQSFATWLQEKGLVGVTVYKYFDPFKVMCTQAVKDGYIQKDPFLNVSLGIKRTKGKRVYLEIEDITRLKIKKLPIDRPDLEDARKLWLFCFYASFYYSDLKSLTWANVKHTDMGFVIVASRFKNENDFIVPVHRFKHATQILNEQKDYVGLGCVAREFVNLIDEGFLIQINEFRITVKLN